MLAIVIVIYPIWTFTFLLLLQVTWCKLHLCKLQSLQIWFSNLQFHFTEVCKIFHVEPCFLKTTQVTLPYEYSLLRLRNTHCQANQHVCWAWHQFINPVYLSHLAYSLHTWLIPRGYSADGGTCSNIIDHSSD